MKFFSTVAFILLTTCTISCDSTKNEVTHDLPKDISKLESLLKSEPDKKIIAEILMELAKAHEESVSGQAVIYYDKLITFADQQDMHFMSGKANYNLGLLYKKKHQYDLAIASYSSSIGKFLMIGDRFRTAWVLNNIGTLLMDVGYYDQAAELLIKLVDFYDQKTDSDKLMRTSLNLGICNIYKKKPNFENSLLLFNKSLAYSNKIQSKKNYYKNWIYNYIGIAHYNSGSYNKAIMAYKMSMGFIRNVVPIDQQDILSGTAYTNIGEAMAAKGAYDEAAKWVKKAIEIEGFDDLEPYLVLATYNVMGQLLQNKGDHLTAKDVFEKGLINSNNKVLNNEVTRAWDMMSQSIAILKKRGVSVTTHPMAKANYQNQLALTEAIKAQMYTVALDNLIDTQQHPVYLTNEDPKDIFMRIGLLSILLLAFAWVRPYIKIRLPHNNN